jgi:hypothetical protein
MAEVENKKQLTIIQGLELFNWEIQSTGDDKEADELAKAAIETYSDSIKEEFGLGSFLFHSLSSYILKQSEQDDCLTQIRFGELLHIASCSGIFYLRTGANAGRSLCLSVDAECISEPPEEGAKFDPFIEEVNLPIESLESVKLVS